MLAKRRHLDERGNSSSTKNSATSSANGRRCLLSSELEGNMEQKHRAENASGTEMPNDENKATHDPLQQFRQALLSCSPCRCSSDVSKESRR
mmetsp:Transcript_25061/g.72476  ORF Transcript_25061/g.72476 Transcript_25061/m.72476 type:complete len:92 (+) Transcript_25061:697-972(+)